MPEGYVEPNASSGFDYVYQYADTRGNIRLSYTDANKDGSITNDEIFEENNYYPFGLKHEKLNPIVSSLRNDVARKFKYNGVEQEEALGLDLYEMEVRSYDPAIARFTGIDPVTHHSMSTYTAFDNNPVYFANPSGADAYNEGHGDEEGRRDSHGRAFLSEGKHISVTDRGGLSTENNLGDEGSSGDEGNDTENNTEDDSNDGDKPIDKNYKGKTKTAPATPFFDKNGNPNTSAYNCHSFAWCNSLGDPNDPVNQQLVKLGITRWDNNPTNNTGGYTPIQFNDTNQIGDRLIYYAWDNKLKKVIPTHSAVVTRIDQQGNTVEVESKWGQAPRFKHHPRDVPSGYGAISPTFIAPDGKTYASRIYFRKKP